MNFRAKPLQTQANEEGRWRDRALNVVESRRGPVEIRRCLGGTPSVFNPLHWVGRCEMGEGGVESGEGAVKAGKEVSNRPERATTFLMAARVGSACRRRTAPSLMAKTE